MRLQKLMAYSVYKMKWNFLFLMAALTLAFGWSSCSFNSMFEDTVNIPRETWNRNYKASFQIPVTDTIKGYNIILSIRNTDDYPNSNLILFVDMLSPNGQTMRDTIDIEMCDSKGRWLGSGIGGLWQKVFYRKSVRFPVSGTYTMQFTQAMRYENLPGISDIGIKVESIKK